jgi:hypothetical protein
MRSGMEDKPLDYPREYVEVHITTAEKKQLEWLALKNDMTISQFIRWRMLDGKDEDRLMTELQKIKKWEKQITELKALHEKREQTSKKTATSRATGAGALPAHLQVPTRKNSRATKKYLLSKSRTSKTSLRKV